jgi:hypothetical protein
MPITKPRPARNRPQMHGLYRWIHFADLALDGILLARNNSGQSCVAGDSIGAGTVYVGIKIVG